MLRFVNFLLAGVTFGLFLLFFIQVDNSHSLWTDSEGQTVRMNLTLFSCTLTSTEKTATYTNFGAYSLLALLLTTLFSIIKKK
jgi:hypothetical protein